MNTIGTDFEARLRVGLADAASAVPPKPEFDLRVVNAFGGPPSRRSRGRWATAAAVAAAVVALIGAAAIATEPASGPQETTIDSAAQTAAAAASVVPGPTTPRPADALRPGGAVLVGSELRSYDDQGAPEGTMSLAPLTTVQAVSSDLAGGWVACGRVADAPPGTPENPFSDNQLVWFAKGKPAKALSSVKPVCVADAVQVVDSAAGPVAIYNTVLVGLVLHAVNLTTGQDTALNVGPQVQIHEAANKPFYRWAATTGRILFNDPTNGFQLFDLATGQSLPVAASIPAGDVNDLVLSPDGASVAVIDGSAMGPVKAVVYDLSTGAQRFQRDLPMPGEGSQLDYDGATIAFGNWYPNNGDFSVVDLAGGASHAIAGHGGLPRS